MFVVVVVVVVVIFDFFCCCTCCCSCCCRCLSCCCCCCCCCLLLLVLLLLLLLLLSLLMVLLWSLLLLSLLFLLLLLFFLMPLCFEPFSSHDIRIQRIRSYLGSLGSARGKQTNKFCQKIRLNLLKNILFHYYSLKNAFEHINYFYCTIERKAIFSKVRTQDFEKLVVFYIFFTKMVLIDSWFNCNFCFVFFANAVRKVLMFLLL